MHRIGQVIVLTLDTGIVVITIAAVFFSVMNPPWVQPEGVLISEAGGVITSHTYKNIESLVASWTLAVFVLCRVSWMCMHSLLVRFGYFTNEGKQKRTESHG